MSNRLTFWAMALLLVLAPLAGCANAVGPFTNHQDIGTPATPGPGTAEFDTAGKTLTLSGGGANIWAGEDDFQFAWKKAFGDITLAANVAFAPGTQGVVEHRKVVLMIRQSLSPDSAYADACIHGNGMTALQWRESTGDKTSYEIEANANAPKRLRIEKRGDYFSMSIGESDGDLRPSGGACKVPLTGDYYIGVGISSHSKDRIEKATFSDIAFDKPPEGTGHTIINTLQTYQLSNRDRKVVWVAVQPRRFEAPNWSRDDSNTLYFNDGGKLKKIAAVLPSSNPTSDVGQKPPELVDLNILTNINNDHVLSFDGKTWAISDQSQGTKRSSVWTLPAAGGAAKQLAESLSYAHGWSPDGKTVVYTAQRNNQYDIYSKAIDGGVETRLTNNKARQDGPEFSPDGQYVYFNSDRTGLMQIWRMKPDGSQPEQITNDEYNNWFPHLSPNGQQMAFISFDKSIRSDDHPEGKDVVVRLMNMSTRAITVAAKLWGGQGTINVPSWSPKGDYFAFVSYQSIQQ